MGFAALAAVDLVAVQVDVVCEAHDGVEHRTPQVTPTSGCVPSPVCVSTGAEVEVCVPLA